MLFLKEIRVVFFGLLTCITWSDRITSRYLTLMYEVREIKIEREMEELY